jgi:putative transposase
VAGVDLGIIHPYALAGPEGQALLVSGRAIRAEHHLHLKDTKARRRAVARRAPKPGQRGVLDLAAGRRHNRRTRDWRVGRLISVLRDKAQQARITLVLADERGTSSTCPACRARVPKPRGRVLCCPRCGLAGHRDLIAAANIAAHAGGGITPAIPAGVTHRRAGNHLPGVSPARRDPRRGPHHGDARGSPGRHLPAPTAAMASRGVARLTARTS